jgi:dTMP kinase
MFIVLEGIDGCGKSLQSRLLVDYLRDQRSLPATWTCEPSKTGPVGMFLRQQILSGKRRLSEHAIMYLFAADRQDHLDVEVGPALQTGQIVVCDRYLLSTLAYQSLSAHGPSLERALEVHGKFPPPDLTVLIDLDMEAVLPRLEHRETSKEIYETRERLIKLVDAYRTIKDLSELKSHNICTVDGSGTVEEVQGQIIEVVDGVLEACTGS